MTNKPLTEFQEQLMDSALAWVCASKMLLYCCAREGEEFEKYLTERAEAKARFCALVENASPLLDSQDCYK